MRLVLRDTQTCADKIRINPCIPMGKISAKAVSVYRGYKNIQNRD